MQPLKHCHLIQGDTSMQDFIAENFRYPVKKVPGEYIHLTQPFYNSWSYLDDSFIFAVHSPWLYSAGSIET
jgi:hypothetical protein